MVYRRFNKAIGKIGNKDVYWVSEVMSSEWVCRRCMGKQPQRSVTLELWVKGKKVSHINTSFNSTTGNMNASATQARIEGEKLWICLRCAEELLEDALTKVRIIKERGKDTFQFMEDV